MLVGEACECILTTYHEKLIIRFQLIQLPTPLPSDEKEKLIISFMGIHYLS